MKSNRRYYNELDREGVLYSLVKDGRPGTLIDRTLGFAYPLTLLTIIAVCTVAFVRIRRLRERWKTGVYGVAAASVLGVGWCLWALKCDPVYPGWFFPPWAVTGIEFGLTLEDWLFMPATTVLFYVLYRMVRMPTSGIVSTRLHVIVLGVYGALAVVFFCVSSLAGKTQTLVFLLPGMVLYWYSRDTINFRKFLLFQAIVIGLEMVWDWTAVSWIHYLPGKAWASQWVSLTADSLGGHHHSKIFLDYDVHRWAWIFANPVEITPWMGICGGMLDFSIFSSADKYFYGKHQ
jgi:hypothetical protein